MSSSWKVALCPSTADFSSPQFSFDPTLAAAAEAAAEEAAGAPPLVGGRRGEGQPARRSRGGGGGQEDGSVAVSELRRVKLKKLLTDLKRSLGHKARKRVRSLRWLAGSGRRRRRRRAAGPQGGGGGGGGRRVGWRVDRPVFPNPPFKESE